MSYVDDLKHELVAASERLTGQPTAALPRRRRAPFSSRALGIAVVGLAVSATAIAATSAWQPLFGAPGDPQPRVAQTAPSADLMALLGVLRRPQTAEDRGSSTRAALRFFGTLTQGIHTNYIRHLPAGEGGLQATLVPATSSRSIPGREADHVACLFVAERTADAGGAGSCYTSAQIQSGAAIGALGSVFYSLVPDGVARVVLRDDDGAHSVEVHDNFYEDGGSHPGQRIPRRVRVIEWLDAEGRPTPFQPTSP